MYEIATKDLLPGMVLAEDLFTMDDNLIATKGTRVSGYLIYYIECYEVFSVKIESLDPND